MNKKNMFLVTGIILLVLVGSAAAIATAASSAKAKICDILDNIQWLLYMIAGGVGIVVITLQGIKWAGSAEDPGARKQAKQGIIHAIIGLLIVLMAVWVVTLVFGQDCDITTV